MQAIARGEFNVGGMQNKNLRRCLSGKTRCRDCSSACACMGSFAKLAAPNKYYLTQFGKQVITTGLKLRELVAIPQLAFAQIA